MQCELDGREVDTGLPDDVKAFDNMFFKSWMNGRVSEHIQLSICGPAVRGRR